MSFKEYTQDQPFLLPLSLHDFVEEGHLARVVNDVVNLLDLEALYARYSEFGCSAYHPQMMLKVLFYGYATGERSSRVLAHRLKSDVAYMYLSGCHRPDFRTLNRFRKDNLEVLKSLFVQVVRLCKAMGMLSVGTLCIDGTKLKANAAQRKTKTEASLQEDIQTIEEKMARILSESETVDEDEDAAYGERSPYEVEEALSAAKTRKEKLKEAKETLAERGEKTINVTDEDARTMVHKGYACEPSYNAFIAVEERHGVIVEAHLSTNASDYDALKPLVDGAEHNTQEACKTLLADSGFSSYENMEYLEKRGTTGYMPDQDMESLNKGTRKNVNFHKSQFVYDKKQDRYLCPMGKPLLFRQAFSPTKRLYRGIACPSCAWRSECTKGKYRHVSQDQREYLQFAMRHRLQTPEGKHLYRKRAYLVEPVFGDLKHNRKCKDLLLRGKFKAYGEFLLMCITYNLRKIATVLRREKSSRLQRLPAPC